MKSRTIILSDADEALLGVIANAHPLVSHHRIAQLALRSGLRTIAEDPTRLVNEAQVLDASVGEGADR